mmetsp:Transcript_63182/g.199886  ORF Transcript_63182/g.199886 Transcript_63182/m.199886 type:complete len:618 (+) Transcript_63182:442-2295(+)
MELNADITLMVLLTFFHLLEPSSAWGGCTALGLPPLPSLCEPPRPRERSDDIDPVRVIVASGEVGTAELAASASPLANRVDRITSTPTHLGLTGSPFSSGTTSPSGSMRMEPRSPTRRSAHCVALRVHARSPPSGCCLSSASTKKAQIIESPANFMTSPPYSSTRVITWEKKLFMHLVRSSTPAVPLFESLSVSGVKPEISATMIAAWYVAMRGSMSVWPPSFLEYSESPPRLGWKEEARSAISSRSILGMKGESLGTVPAATRMRHCAPFLASRYTLMNPCLRPKSLRPLSASATTAVLATSAISSSLRLETGFLNPLASLTIMRTRRLATAQSSRPVRGTMGPVVVGRSVENELLSDLDCACSRFICSASMALSLATSFCVSVISSSSTSSSALEPGAAAAAPPAPPAGSCPPSSPRLRIAATPPKARSTPIFMRALFHPMLCAAGSASSSASAGVGVPWVVDFDALEGVLGCESMLFLEDVGVAPMMLLRDVVAGLATVLSVPEGALVFMSPSPSLLIALRLNPLAFHALLSPGPATPVLNLLNRLVGLASSLAAGGVPTMDSLFWRLRGVCGLSPTACPPVSPRRCGSKTLTAFSFSFALFQAFCPPTVLSCE